MTTFEFQHLVTDTDLNGQLSELFGQDETTFDIHRYIAKAVRKLQVEGLIFPKDEAQSVYELTSNSNLGTTIREVMENGKFNLKDPSTLDFVVNIIKSINCYSCIPKNVIVNFFPTNNDSRFDRK